MANNRVTSEILDLMPPSNLEAEMAVIGSAMLDPRIIDSISLEPEEFYADSNRILWRVFRELRNQRHPIDALVILNRLDASRELAVVGGAEYIAKCAYAVPYAANAPHYAGIIREKAKMRAILDAATIALRDCYGSTSKSEDVLATLEGSVYKIGTGSYSSSEPVEYSIAIMNALEKIEEINKRQCSAGILTGFEQVDLETGGLFPGEFNVLAARPGQGKSAAAMQIAMHAGLHDHRVYYATLEMKATELAMRQLCSAARVSSQKVRTGRLIQSDISAFTEASIWSARANIVIQDWPRIRVYDIRRAAKKSKADLIIVDYLQLIKPSETKGKQRHEQVGEIAHSLKELAGEMNVPVLALAQLNRAAEQGKELRPKLSHLRESGDIEQDADVVIFIYRPDEKIPEYANGVKHKKDEVPIDEYDAIFDLAKNRNGAGSKTFKMDWHASRTMFTDHQKFKKPDDFEDYSTSDVRELF